MTTLGKCLIVMISSAMATSFLATTASATLVGPVYPPTSGVTFTPGAGSSGGAGGKTNTYSGIDETQFSQLFWGPQDANAVGAALDGTIDSPGETLALNLGSINVVNGVGSAEWDGQSTASTAFGLRTADIRFLLTITDTLGATPFLVNAPSVTGMPTPGNFALVDVLQIAALSNTNGDFLANLQFQARDANTANAYQPIDTYFNGLNASSCGGPCVRTSVSGGFYEQAAAVSEPASLACLGLGLVALGYTRRRHSSTRET